MEDMEAPAAHTNPHGGTRGCRHGLEAPAAHTKLHGDTNLILYYTRGCRHGLEAPAAHTNPTAAPI